MKAGLIRPWIARPAGGCSIQSIGSSEATYAKQIRNNIEMQELS
jgi:hypothetical protein